MDNKYLMEYLELKQWADEAFEKWENSQSGKDWQDFLTFEHKCADYAFENEKRIWPNG